MSIQRFPLFSGQPGAVVETFRIDGSEVAAASGSGGLDGRGKFICTIKKLNNRVTIDWIRAYAEHPDVTFQPAAAQNDTIVQIVTETGAQLVFDTVKASDNSAVNDADLIVHLVGYNTTNYVS